MAWLDDSPVVNAGKQGLGISASIIGQIGTHNLGKFRIISQFPIINLIYRFYLSHFLSRSLHKKLNGIEKKIRFSKLESIESVTEILRDLMQTKRLSDHNFFNNVKKQVQQRIDHLKTSLIKKSHQVADDNENPETHSNKVFENTHQHVLSMINQVTQKITHQPSIPSKLHWLAHNEEWVHPAFATPKQTLIHLHTSCEKLVRILANKMQVNLLLHKNDIRICDQNVLLESNSPLVCGVSLKLLPHVNFASKKPSFWQQQLLLDSFFLTSSQNKKLKENINEIFFQTADHYEHFQELLLLHQETELLDFVTTLEKQQQIIIHNPSLNSCTF